MKRYFMLLILVGFTFASSYGQEDRPITILKEEKGNIIILSALNSDATANYKVVLEIESKGFKLTKPVPVSKIVLSGKSTEMIQLIAKPDVPKSLKYKYKISKVSNIIGTSKMTRIN